MRLPAAVLRVALAGALLPLLNFAGCSSGPSLTVPPPIPHNVVCGISQPIAMQVFKDPFHVQPQCQFNVRNSAGAYVLVSDIVASDKYVMYVQTSDVKARCVYMTPAINAGNCDFAAAPGVLAPGGNLGLTWAFGSALKAGNYTISLYDQTAGSVLGTVQVSLANGY